MAIFLSLCWDGQEWGVLSCLLWEPGWAPGGKTQKVAGLLRLGPLDPLNLKFVHIEPPAIHQLHLSFSTQCCFPEVSVSAKMSFSVITCLCLQFSGQHFALWPKFSDGSRKCCWFWFVQLPPPPPVVRLGVTIASSSHIRLQIASFILVFTECVLMWTEHLLCARYYPSSPLVYMLLLHERRQHKTEYLELFWW